jgi:hypothetical protein
LARGTGEAARPTLANPYGDGRAATRIVARLRRLSGLAHEAASDGLDEWRPS